MVVDGSCSLKRKGEVGKHQFFSAAPAVRMYFNLERLRDISG